MVLFLVFSIRNLHYWYHIKCFKAAGKRSNEDMCPHFEFYSTRVKDMQCPRLGKPRRALQIFDNRVDFPVPGKSGGRFYYSSSPHVVHQQRHTPSPWDFLKPPRCTKTFTLSSCPLVAAPSKSLAYQNPSCCQPYDTNQVVSVPKAFRFLCCLPCDTNQVVNIPKSFKLPCCLPCDTNQVVSVPNAFRFFMLSTMWYQPSR